MLAILKMEALAAWREKEELANSHQVIVESLQRTITQLEVRLREISIQKEEEQAVYLNQIIDLEQNLQLAESQRPTCSSAREDVLETSHLWDQVLRTAKDEADTISQDRQMLAVLLSGLEAMVL
jgi:uncharacterized coiled-coil DUF342 family protein